jgi:hypothetical protein
MATGICHICGQVKPLSFEHISPRAAFNNRPVITIPLEQAIRLGPIERPRGRIKQKGMGDYVLCNACNNNTGSWYASRFVDWCYRGMEVLKLSNSAPNLVYTYQIYPLSVLKQIVVMILAINNPGFSKANPDLANFVRQKDNQNLPPRYRIYTYYNLIGMHRNIGLSAKVSFPSGKSRMMSEVSFPPFGYLLTLDSDSPDRRLVDITGFTNYGYDDLAEIQMKLAVLPIHLLYPGDYRSKEEIERTRDTSEQPSA